MSCDTKCGLCWEIPATFKWLVLKQWNIYSNRCFTKHSKQTMSWCVLHTNHIWFSIAIFNMFPKDAKQYRIQCWWTFVKVLFFFYQFDYSHACITLRYWLQFRVEMDRIVRQKVHDRFMFCRSLCVCLFVSVFKFFMYDGVITKYYN